jgi:hypothetical protein
MKTPVAAVASRSALEDVSRQLADARKALADIQRKNRREGVLNEHMVHSEMSAEQRIESLGKKLAHLKANLRDMETGSRDGATAGE